MREYFSGWKRKVGVVTLLAACVFMSGWIRSQFHLDFLECQASNHATEYLLSGDRCVMWQHRQLIVQESGKTFLRWSSGPFESLDARPHSVYQWRWRWLGFGVADWTVQPPNVVRITMWVIPYWSIVIPLTALSAWLLLSKPRPTRQHSMSPTN